MSAESEKNLFINVGKIKGLLDTRGIPYAEFGRRIGLTNRESISRRLQNKHKISGDELIQMSIELGVPVEELCVA